MNRMVSDFRRLKLLQYCFPQNDVTGILYLFLLLLLVNLGHVCCLLLLTFNGAGIQESKHINLQPQSVARLQSWTLFQIKIIVSISSSYNLSSSLHLLTDSVGIVFCTDQDKLSAGAIPEIQGVFLLLLGTTARKQWRNSLK